MFAFSSSVVFALSVIFGSETTFASGNTDSTGFLFSESASSEINLIMQTLQVLAALGITLLLLIVAMWLLKKLLRLRGVTGAPGGAIQVLTIQHIDPKKSIALVRILDRILIVGCAENSLSNLGELSADDIGELDLNRKADTGIFSAILARFTGRGSTGPAEKGMDDSAG